MEVVHYKSINGLYSKVPCTIDDIEGDIQRIKESLDSQGESFEHTEEYASSMAQSVYQDKAFAIYKDDVRLGFMYNRTDEAFPSKLVACSLIVPSDIVALVILFVTLSFTNYKTIIVFPHGRNLMSFKSFISKTSLRAYNSGMEKYIRIERSQQSTAVIRTLVKRLKITKVKP